MWEPKTTKKKIQKQQKIAFSYVELTNQLSF